MQSNKILLPVILMFVLLLSVQALAQDCNAAAITTKESYLYGRYEVMMQSAAGEGIVSSFFLYNVETNCNWPAENNEIDVEMTGNSELLYFTTHHPNPVQPWSIGENFSLGFNPHAAFHQYTIEWEPEIIRWFVDGELIYVQNGTSTSNLQYPMAILMNLWAAKAESWVGIWDPTILPRQSKYEYVKYYAYTPGQGSVGTNNQFTFQWEDHFTTLDTARWTVSDFSGFSGNYCTFRANNVEVDEDQLVLSITAPQVNTELIPVTFSVNMNTYDLLASDKVYLNGTFNDWCGDCQPMVEVDGIWSSTINLPPGKYEYLFTINGWSEVGNAPLGSECDYLACDEYGNYGILVAAASDPIITKTYCWEACSNCLNTSSKPPPAQAEKKLIGIYDILGQPVKEARGQLLFYWYDDGTVEKKIQLLED